MAWCCVDVTTADEMYLEPDVRIITCFKEELCGSRLEVLFFHKSMFSVRAVTTTFFLENSAAL